MAEAARWAAEGEEEEEDVGESLGLAREGARRLNKSMADRVARAVQGGGG